LGTLELCCENDGEKSDGRGELELHDSDLNCWTRIKKGWQ
jgi:hypothetical protein